MPITVEFGPPPDEKKDPASPPNKYEGLSLVAPGDSSPAEPAAAVAAAVAPAPKPAPKPNQEGPAGYTPPEFQGGADEGVTDGLVEAVIQQESGGDPDAVSSAGAIGLMQLMPPTANDLGVDPTDPIQNVEGGTRYLKQLFKRYDGDPELALMAYNWGMGNVDNWVAGGRVGHVPPETVDYAAKLVPFAGTMATPAFGRNAKPKSKQAMPLAAQETQAPPTDNKYGGMAAADTAYHAKITREAVKDTKPDQAAEASALAQATGLPVDTVLRNPDKAKAQVLKTQQERALDSSPVTAKHMTDPEFAAVAHEDIGRLADVEKTAERQLQPSDRDAHNNNEDIPIPPRRSVVGNLAAGIGERFFSAIIGGSVSLVGTIADDTADWLERGLPLGQITYNFTGDEANGPLVGWRPTTEEDLALPSPLEKFADDFRNVDLNYQEGTSWQDVKDHPLQNFLPFALEQGIVSAPDMIATLRNMPGYVVARTGEIGTTRADNDGRTEATIADLVAAAPAAVGSAILERLGTRGWLGLGSAAVGKGIKGVGTSALKAGVKEAGTETLQEGAESLAETVGTKTGFDALVTLDRMAAGAVGGFGFGTVARSATAPIQQNIQAAKEHKIALDRIQEVIDRNPMTERDPAKAAQHYADSKPGEKVHYVTIQAIDELADKTEVSVGEVYERLGVTDQVEEAHLLNGDVSIPAANYAQHVLMQPDVYVALVEHTREHPNALTPFEAEQEEAGLVAEADAEAQAAEADQEAAVALEDDVALVDTPEGQIADRRAVPREDSVAANQATFRAEAARAAGDEQAAARWARIGQRIGQGDEELADLVEAHDAAEGTARLRLEDQIEEILSAEEAIQDAQEGIIEAAAPSSPDLEPASADVSLARVELGLWNLFVTADEAGMTPRQYESYLLAVAQAAEGTQKRQEQALLKKRKAANEEKLAEEREIVAEEMRESVQAQPVYAAMNSIGQDRMNRDAVIEILPDGEAQLAELPKIRGRFLHTNKREKGGSNPDVLAENFGFPDAQTMLFSMMDAPLEADAIKGATDAEMRRRHPELHEEQRMIAEAIENLHTDKQGAILAMEMNALREAKGDKRLSRQLITSEARRRMGDKVISKVRVDHLLAEEKRHGRTAGKLLRAGDREGAAQAAFRRVMAFEMAKAAMKTRAEVARKKKYMEDFLKKGRKFPNIDADYVDSIFELLGQYSLGSKPRGDKDMAAWREKEIDEGAVLTMEPTLYAGVRNWQDMTVDEFDALYRGVKNIEAQGKLKKGLITSGEDVDFNERKEELIDAADKLEDTGRVKRARESLARSWKDVQLGRIATLDAGIRRVEFLMKTLDNFDIGGIWQRTIFQPFADAQAKFSDMMKTTGQPIIKALNSLPKETRKRLGKTMYVPSLRRTMTRGQLIMVALNTGNDSNLTKMVRGSEMDDGAPAWTEAQVDEAMKLLTPEEAKWIQLVWDSYAELQPEVARIFRAENGVAPTEITPRATEIGGIVVNGGYFPMMYRQDAKRPTPESALEAMQAAHVRAGVYAGMTVERTGFVAPVLLDLEAMPRGLHQQLHYISHYEAVRDVNRTIRDPQIKRAISNKLGTEYYDNIDEWVKALATAGANQKNLSGWDDFVSFFRGNVTAAVMTGSYTTGLAQTFGLSTSVAVLGQKEGGKMSSVEGTKWLASGFETYAAHPIESVKMMKRMSGEMRHRIYNTDRDMTDAMTRAGISTSKGKMRSMVEYNQRVGFLAIAGIQMYSVDVPTWLGGFNQALSRGKSEQEAVNHADSVVRLSQASGATKDLSTLQRKKDLWRAVTMFSTYVITLYNLQAETFGAAKRNPKDIASVVARMVWLVMLPAMADALMRQEFPDDRDDQDPATFAALKILGYSLGSIPIVGRGFESAISGFTPTATPIETLPKAIIKALDKMGEAWDDGELNSETARAIWVAAGTGVGIPGTYQVNRMWSAIEAGDDAEIYDILIGYRDRTKRR